MTPAGTRTPRATVRAARSHRRRRGPRWGLVSALVPSLIAGMLAPDAVRADGGGLHPGSEGATLQPGETIRFGRVKVAVPQAGRGLTIVLDHVDGSARTLTLTTDRSGTVSVSRRFDQGPSFRLSALGIADEHDEPEEPQGPDAIDPCKNKTFRLLGHRWNRRFDWYLKRSSIPKRLPRNATTRLIKRSANTIVKSRNRCGLADRVRARQKYMGPTKRGPGICRGRPDGRNVVVFKRLGWWLNGFACIMSDFQGSRLVGMEADVVINRNPKWLLKPDPDCDPNSSLSDEQPLGPTVTHEFGHVFGLGHPPSHERHAQLTMFPGALGGCDDRFGAFSRQRLARGDVLGLRRLYR